MFKLSDYDYKLPEKLIADYPLSQRDDSRLLLLDRFSASIKHKKFKDIRDLLKKGDLLILNDTRVIPARFEGYKETGGRVEVFLLDYIKGCKNLKEEGVFQSSCLLKSSKRPLKGSYLLISDKLKARVESLNQDGSALLSFHSEMPFPEVLFEAGRIPLPPYIKRESEDLRDRENYQTVYAKKEGAVAAPTAGLHFTEDLLSSLKEKGVEIAYLTLHTGYGTFAPVRVEDIRDHKMHAEYFELSDETALAIRKAKKEGRRLIAVGTTSLRTLEYLAADNKEISAKEGLCDLFIYPGFKFKLVDALITNFHLPKSTLLMLVSAFAGYDFIKDAYKEALMEEYRFFSYGDASFII